MIQATDGWWRFLFESFDKIQVEKEVLYIHVYFQVSEQ